MRANIAKNYERNSVDVYLTKSFGDIGSGKRFVAVPMDIRFEVRGEGDAGGPMLRIKNDEADALLQALFEALIDYGFQAPSKKAELEATKYHLEDLRELLKLGGRK